MRIGRIIVAAAIGIIPITAHAQEAKPTCANMDTALSPETAGWTTKSDVGSATTAGELDKASLVLGHGTNAALHPTRQVSYVTQPEKPGGSVSFGGMLKLTVAKAGTYKVGIASGAWIDLLKGNTVLMSTAHGHGPECSTLRKVVDFALDPGSYVVQISANAEPTLAIMVWRQP